MPTWNRHSADVFLRELWAQALAAVSAERCLPPYLPAVPTQKDGRLLVIGAGKAAAAMARSLEKHYQATVGSELSTTFSSQRVNQQLRLSGMVIVPYGHRVECAWIQVREASHPIPDAAGSEAAREMLELVRGLSAHDSVICLLSGGGSALMSLPAEGLTLEQKQAINRALLRSGARIHEINCVRKHLSAIKGGRLALACEPARVWSFIISDVAGDDASIIASGPTLPDASTTVEALAILRHCQIDIPNKVLEYLQSPAAETPKANLPSLHNPHYQIVANARDALEGAATWARQQGVRVEILSDCLEGEASDLGYQHASYARSLANQGDSCGSVDRQGPILLLSGGETTVTLSGGDQSEGRGGRNTEYLLSLCLHLKGDPRIYALAADTDGRDGSEANAGALCFPDSLLVAASAGVNAETSLARHDAFTFFETTGDLLFSGPSLTNVNDFRAILIV
ncbi:glycerate kinase type-2 family protein [Undibacterium fentianense]|uniref:Glycerate kinase n=1 Tax=Undibacterium fentianense TaxID=2828728 RepID=A0A941E4Y5_9BURK|nr:glycerate kinase [Undibacterium fentianense]MBR7800699.1 glycerate kinase [Undibacterium fentianense]